MACEKIDFEHTGEAQLPTTSKLIVQIKDPQKQKNRDRTINGHVYD